MRTDCGRGEAWNPPLAAENGGAVSWEESAAGARDLVARVGREETSQGEMGNRSGRREDAGQGLCGTSVAGVGTGSVEGGGE